MNEQQTMLADMASALFADLGPAATLQTGWPQIEEMGFTGLLLDEASGGFGGGWMDAGIVFRLAGYNGLALPLVEAVIAARLAADANYEGEGFGSIAAKAEGSLENGRFRGWLKAIPWGRDASFIIMPAPSGSGAAIVSTADARVVEGTNMAGEPRDSLEFTDAPAVAVDADIFSLGAAARAMQMAGALDSALVMAVTYVNDRKQFGKPLGKLQAVQQALAVFAGEAAATNCAATGVAQALDRGNADFEIAAAKARSNMAAGVCASIAHQVHGAIGFTEEYKLHPLTRRLWSWRSEFGGEHYWTLSLGRKSVERGAENFWPDLVRRTDPVD